MALDFIGGVILIAAVVVNISVFANALGISQPARIDLSPLPAFGRACNCRSMRPAPTSRRSCKPFR